MKSVKEYMTEIFNNLPGELQQKAIEENMYMKLMDINIVIELRFYEKGKSANKIIVHNRYSKMYMIDINIDDDKKIGVYNGHVQIGNHQILYRNGMYWHIGSDEFRFLKDATLEDYERKLI